MLTIEKKIKKKEEELKILMEKKDKVETKIKETMGEIEDLQNNKLAKEMKEINVKLNAKGIKLTDIVDAINRNDVERLNRLIKEKNNKN
ncbi:hypothetical protein [Gemella morbillorum]